MFGIVAVTSDYRDFDSGVGPFFYNTRVSVRDFVIWKPNVTNDTGMEPWSMSAL